MSQLTVILLLFNLIIQAEASPSKVTSLPVTYIKVSHPYACNVKTGKQHVLVSVFGINMKNYIKCFLQKNQTSKSTSIQHHAR